MVQPFHFHEPKNDPSLRKHLDLENQLSRPQKKCCKRSASARLNFDLMETENKPLPPTTKKFDAYVSMRREQQTKKLIEE